MVKPLSGSGVLNGDKKEADCGVYAEAEDGFGFQENCEYIHETVSVDDDDDDDHHHHHHPS